MVYDESLWGKIVNVHWRTTPKPVPSTIDVTLNVAGATQGGFVIFPVSVFLSAKHPDHTIVNSSPFDATPTFNAVKPFSGTVSLTNQPSGTLFQLVCQFGAGQTPGFPFDAGGSPFHEGAVMRILFGKPPLSIQESGETNNAAISTANIVETFHPPPSDHTPHPPITITLVEAKQSADPNASHYMLAPGSPTQINNDRFVAWPLSLDFSGRKGIFAGGSYHLSDPWAAT